MPTTFEPDSIEEKVIEVVKEAAAKPEGGDDDEEAAAEDPAEGEGEEAKKSSWKPTDHRWTVTNGKSKNLPQLFRDYMGNRANFEEKNWKSYGANSHGDAAVKALDEFCQKVNDEGQSIYLYQQVIFNDLD